jgi:hypothetical protein
MNWHEILSRWAGDHWPYLRGKRILRVERGGVFGVWWSVVGSFGRVTCSCLRQLYEVVRGSTYFGLTSLTTPSWHCRLATLFFFHTLVGGDPLRVLTSHLNSSVLCKPCCHHVRSAIDPVPRRFSLFTCHIPSMPCQPFQAHLKISCGFCL